MAEYVNPDDPDGTIGEQMRARLRPPAGRHALRPPSATRYEPALPPVAEAAPATPSRVPPFLALACTLTLSIAQGVVTYPDALSGLPEGVLRAVLAVAQLVVVLAAIYRMGPAR